MARSLGLEVLKSNYSDPRIPVMEHCMGSSRQLIQHLSGIDPIKEPNRLNEAFRRLADAMEIDLLWGGGLPRDIDATSDTVRGHADIFDWSDGQRVKTTRDGLTVVQWGIFGAAHQEDGRHFVHIPKPDSLAAALDFDPLVYFPKTVDEYRDEFTIKYQQMRESCGDVCVPLPHHYTTCFHWPLAIFGFELLCEAGMEEKPFHELMQRFAHVSVRIATAWSQVPGLEGFIMHDDLTMTQGPLFAPSWYREHIFCHYPAIFEPLNKAGIPLIFTSDGDCTVFVDDIFNAGADGLNFEYLVDLKMLVEKHNDKILIGNINSGTIAHGTPDEILQTTRQCIEIGSHAPRFVVNVGGGITHDISPNAMDTYLHVRKQLCREIRQMAQTVR